MGEVGHQGNILSCIPAMGKLYAVDLNFIPHTKAPVHSSVPEFSVFVQAPRALNLWHARLGHLGHAAVTRLDKVVRGVTFDSSSPLSICESCTMAKHPHLLFYSSETQCASKFLELIYSDLCGPIPVITPHSKHYFIIFLDDYTQILNVQLLTSKDQALSAWTMVQAKWENLSRLQVKVFCSDNGGEFMNDTFMMALESAGIKQQCSVPYTHQQNGKAKHVMHTIEGCMYTMLDHACLL